MACTCPARSGWSPSWRCSPYLLSAGEYTLVASGIDGSGVTGCHQTGSKRFTIPPGQGNLRVSGTGPKLVAPYAYSFQALPRFATMTVTRVDCPPDTDPGEGTTYETGLFTPFNTTHSQSSPDGMSYIGTEDQTINGSGLAFSWAFQGTQ